MRALRVAIMIGLVAVAASAMGCGIIQGLIGGMSGDPITVGTPVSGSLEASDRTDIFQDGSYTDVYELEMTAAQQVVITMASPTFDTFMTVQQSRGEPLAQNDDGVPGTTNSRIAFTAPSAGTFYIAATSLGTGITGAYTVTVTAPGAPAAAAPAAAPGMPVAPPAAPAAPVAQ